MSAVTLTPIQNPIQAENALSFFRIVGYLKNVKRTGWVNNNIDKPESVADHMYRMSMLATMLVDSSINKDHLIKLCLVHDLAEAIVGDITPHDTKVNSEQKHVLEVEAMKTIAEVIGNAHLADDILLLWSEYEGISNEGTKVELTNESKIAHQLDKLEMIIQADEYERADSNLNLQDFFDSTQNSFDHVEIVEWVNELRKQRNERRTKNSDRVVFDNQRV